MSPTIFNIFSGIHINSMENKKTEWCSEIQWKECNYTPQKTHKMIITHEWLANMCGKLLYTSHANMALIMYLLYNYVTMEPRKSHVK